MPTPLLAEVLAEIRRFAATAKSLPLLQEFCVEIISRRLSGYDWAGFYMLDPGDENALVLGPFRGAPTEHVRIPVTQGICGAAVARGETVVVGDVSLDPRYLACSVETKSEIVVPLRIGGRIAGEIDVDGHALNAFGPEDRAFLEECAAIIEQSIRLAGAPLLSKLQGIVGQRLSRGARAQQVAQAIREHGAFRWVGLYDVYSEPGLVSNIAWNGPHAPSHPAFPITHGLTSRVVERAKTVNVGDVLKDPSYLTTLDSTRSELIVPVVAEQAVLGTIDVESECPNAFDWGIQTLLEDCANRLTDLWSDRGLDETPGVQSVTSR